MNSCYWYGTGTPYVWDDVGRVPDTHPMPGVWLTQPLTVRPQELAAAKLNTDGTVTVNGMRFRYDGAQWVLVA